MKLMCSDMRNIFIGCVALVLAGCTANQEVDLESRDFMVQQNAVPASTGVESTEHMARLLKLSGPTYVTLVVSDGEKQTTSSRPSENRAIPVTSGSGFLVDSGGYVMTAAHVAVRKGNTVSARAANGRIYSGQVVDILPSNDMALIKLRGFSGKATSPAPRPGTTSCFRCAGTCWGWRRTRFRSRQRCKCWGGIRGKSACR